jgi:dTDP-4-amino-4,6-dideoxygalactose transaminase
MKKIPSANPLASFEVQREEILAAVSQVLASGQYILGPSVELFESAFADFLGARFSVGVASGTDAIFLALKALGVGSGDRVIAPAHTAVATIAAIELAGAEAILADIEPSTFTLSPSSVESILKQDVEHQVKCVIPVHLYGHPADMGAILELAQNRNVKVLEDCAQAHGARWEGKRCGILGHLGAFSFYPTKNLGAFGDGGAICGNDASYLKPLKLLRQYGWAKRYESTLPGFNSRLDEMQAAILNVKLKNLEAGNQARRNIADVYKKALAGLPVVLPVEKPGCHHVYHQYTIRCKERDALAQWLMEKGVAASILYPSPLHLQPAYRNRVRLAPGGLREAELACSELLCLPIYPELGLNDAEQVAETIKSFYDRSKPVVN